MCTECILRSYWSDGYKLPSVPQHCGGKSSSVTSADMKWVSRLLIPEGVQGVLVVYFVREIWSGYAKPIKLTATTRTAWHLALWLVLKFLTKTQEWGGVQGHRKQVFVLKLSIVLCLNDLQHVCSESNYNSCLQWSCSGFVLNMVPWAFLSLILAYLEYKKDKCRL